MEEKPNKPSKYNAHFYWLVDADLSESAIQATLEEYGQSNGDTVPADEGGEESTSKNTSNAQVAQIDEQLDNLRAHEGRQIVRIRRNLSRALYDTRDKRDDTKREEEKQKRPITYDWDISPLSAEVMKTDEEIIAQRGAKRHAEVDEAGAENNTGAPVGIIDAVDESANEVCTQEKKERSQDQSAETSVKTGTESEIAEQEKKVKKDDVNKDKVEKDKKNGENITNAPVGEQTAQNGKEISSTDKKNDGNDEPDLEKLRFDATTKKKKTKKNKKKGKRTIRIPPELDILTDVMEPNGKMHTIRNTVGTNIIVDIVRQLNSAATRRGEQTQIILPSLQNMDHLANELAERIDSMNIGTATLLSIEEGFNKVIACEMARQLALKSVMGNDSKFCRKSCVSTEKKKPDHAQPKLNSNISEGTERKKPTNRKQKIGVRVGRASEEWEFFHGKHNRVDDIIFFTQPNEQEMLLNEYHQKLKQIASHVKELCNVNMIIWQQVDTPYMWMLKLYFGTDGDQTAPFAMIKINLNDSTFKCE